MRKVRDYDAELKALQEKARGLKARRVEQLGQLVAATGADALDVAVLAGALLEAAGSKDSTTKEGWAARGAAFFQRRGRTNGHATQGDGQGASANGDGGAAGGSRAAADR